MNHADFRELIRTRIESRANRPDRGFEILNATGDGDQPAEIRIYDVIGWPWLEARDIVEQLDEITATEILVSINSPGGDVFDSIAIYNALRQHPAHITTRVDGLAASGASIIAQAGDNRIMVTASQMMIHNAWVFAIGDAPYLREVADTLEKSDDILASIYARHSGGSKAHFREMMDDESWFNDSETVAEGLADEVVDPPRKTKSGEDDDPEASHPRRFSEHASEVVAAAEQLLERAEKVIAFRTDQGKPPLAEDSVELLEGLRAHLDEVLTSEEIPEDEEQTVDDDLILRSFANLQGD